MAVLKNRAKMSTSTTGTGTITLGSAESGYQTFADAGVANGDVVRYVIEDGNNWEIGTGTYTATGTTLSRTVSESSNSDAAINLSGSATVFIGAAAEDVVGGPRGADFDDNVKVRFGTTPDLEIYSDGTKSVINEIGSSHLVIQGQEIQFNNAAGTRLMDINSAQVELRHSGNKKMETNSAGIQTTGTVNVNGAYTLPTSDGTNGQVLTTDGSGAVTFADAGGGGGADLYAANPSSATDPTANALNSVAIGDGMTTGSSAVGGIAIGQDGTVSGTNSVSLGKSGAYGTGSFAAAISSVSYQTYGADGDYSISVGYRSRASSSGAIAIGYEAKSLNNYSTAISRSYASGTDSFAAAIATNSSSYGATGANSIAMGKLAKATGAYSTAIGESTEATASNSVCLGYYSQSTAQGSVAIGYDAQATAAKSFSFGLKVRNAIQNAFRFAGGHFSSAGDAQSGIYILRSDTTDATAEALTTNNSTASTDNQIILANEAAMTFTGTVVVREDATDGDDYAGWEIKGVIMRQGQASDTALGTGIVNSLYHTAGLANAAVALSADTTNGGLKIQVTGIASTNLNWVATVHTSEVVNA